MESEGGRRGRGRQGEGGAAAVASVVAARKQCAQAKERKRDECIRCIDTLR